MRPDLQALPDVEEAAAAGIHALDLDWAVTVLDWRVASAAETLDTALKRGSAVLVLAPDEAAVIEALDLGATEAIVWPTGTAHLLARIRRAARMVRQPWLERVVQLLDDSVEIADTGAALIDVNPGFERVTGYPRQEVLGRTTASLFRVETADPRYYQQIGAGLAASGVWKGQLTARRHDGSLSFMQATIATVPDATGRVVGHLAVKRDASRDDLAASALANAEARTRTLMDHAAEAVVLHGPDGQIVDVNSSACRMLGADRAALLARTVDSFEIGADLAGLRAWWGSLGEAPVSRETAWRREDGSTVPVEISAGRVHLVGNPFVFVVARDIAERHRAQAALHALNTQLESLNEGLESEVAARTTEVREALARQAAIVDAVADGLIAVSADHTVSRANPAAVRMFDLVTANGLVVEALHPSLGGLADECMRSRIEQTIHLPTSGNRSLTAKASPILLDDRKTVAGCVILLRDVTQEREIDRMKTDFIATVSHELRTPLTSVLGFAKLARSRLDLLLPLVPPDDRKLVRAGEQVAGNLDVISSEGQRLADLINDVLDISKMEAGRVDWREEVVRASDLVDRALVATAALFADSPVQCIREIEPGLPPLVGDENRLLQVLINLLSNAAKFTEVGSIRVGARRVDEGIEISVADTGPGIPTSDHGLIFERFRQSSSDTLTNKPRGTGLGLAISKHIIEHHGGRIWVDSAVGEGSRFVFVLPLHSEASAVVPPSDGALSGLLSRIGELFPAVAEQRGADILVVDDDPSARELLRQVLSDAGHHVRTASDGVSAVAEVRRKRPELLVLDVLMPGLTGFDVAALVRADPLTQEVPILVLSVLSDPDRGVRLGVDRYLNKPVAWPDLLAAIETLLRRASLPRRVLIVDSSADHAQKVRAALESDRCLVLGTCDVDEALPRARELAPDLVVVGAGAAGLVESLRDDAALRHVAVVALVES